MRTLVALNTWCGLHVIQDFRYYETSPSHLHPISVDKQLLPKRRTLPVLCSICLNSLLVPPCWHHFPESSVASFTLPQCWGTHACTPTTLGPTPHWSPVPHPWQLFLSAASEQVVSEGLTLFLHGLRFLLVHNVNFQNNRLVLFWGSHLNNMLLWKSQYFGRLHCNLFVPSILMQLTVPQV